MGKNGKLKPHHVSGAGHRYYSEQQCNYYLGFNGFNKQQRKIIGYCRVSSAKQKDDLERQIDNIRTYMIAKGYQFDIISDIGSGINYNKKGFVNLIEMIVSNQVEKIVVLYKDRLLRFGFEIIENLCKMYDTSIEIADTTEKTEEQELVEDMIQIITVFSCRLQGKRANNTGEASKINCDCIMS